MYILIKLGLTAHIRNSTAGKLVGVIELQYCSTKSNVYSLFMLLDKIDSYVVISLFIRFHAVVETIIRK